MRFKERHSPLLSQRLYVVPMTTRKQGSAQRQIPLLNYLVLFKSASTLNLTNAHTHRRTDTRTVHPNAHTHTRSSMPQIVSPLPASFLLMRKKSTIMCDANV